MSSRKTTKARDAIVAAAEANGWRYREGGQNLTLTRGSVTIAVRFGSTGDIYSASIAGVRSLNGPGKLPKVLAELNRKP